MTAPYVLAALLVGTWIGALRVAFTAAGRREDDCRACRKRQLDQAFRDADDCGYGGTND